MEYLKRLCNVILFFIIWIGLAGLSVYIIGDKGAWSFMLFTWIIAFLVVTYLDDK